MAQSRGAGRGPVVAHKADNEEILLRLFQTVERDPSVTQRLVAGELGIALGLANAYLKRCVRLGLIKVRQVPTRRYAYYLTPKGFAEKSRLTGKYLSDSFSFYRRARSECGALFAEAIAKGQKRFALVGAGDLAVISGIVASEYPIENLGTIASDEEPEKLADAVAALGSVDAVMITALVKPRDAFDAAVAAFGPDRVYVPPLLNIVLGRETTNPEVAR